MFDMSDWLYEYMQDIPHNDLIEIMWEALDNMQAFNGRSKTYCVAMAIPTIEIIEDDDGKTKYKIRPYNS